MFKNLRHLGAECNPAPWRCGGVSIAPSMRAPLSWAFALTPNTVIVNMLARVPACRP
jgi:hypothetical protein